MKKLIQFELMKIIRRRLTLFGAIVVLALSVLYSYSTYHNMYAFDGADREGTGRIAVEIDKDIAAKYAGILTDEKVLQMLHDFAPKSIENMFGMNAIYLYRNAMQSAVYARFSDQDGNWNGLRVSDVFGEEEIKIGYINGWLQTSQNMIRIFLVMAFVIIIMNAPIYASEYDGVDNIIFTSRYGKTKCATAKAAAGILSALFITFIVSFINVLFALVLYGAEGLDCSILFAQLTMVERHIPYNITCGTLLIYQILLAFTGAVSVAGITLLLSALCRNQIVALVSSAAVYILPIMLPISENSSLFKWIVLLPLYHAQFISLMSVRQMENGLLYAIWAVVAAVIIVVTGFILSRRIFARHEVL